MRALAETLIRQAAVAAGMDGGHVMDAPDRQGITLPVPRLELEYLPGNLTRSFKRIARFPKPGEESRCRIIRERIYFRELTVRAVVRHEDEVWIEDFVTAFVVALPAKTADEANNLVTVRADRAVWGGFGTRIVEAFKRRSNALHIVFKGMITQDREVPLYSDVNLVDGITVKGG